MQTSHQVITADHVTSRVAMISNTISFESVMKAVHQVRNIAYSYHPVKKGYHLVLCNCSNATVMVFTLCDHNSVSSLANALLHD